MDPNALDVLEFPAIRERVARATATDFGAALAAELEPSPDPDEVARRQALTAEAIGLLDESLEPPLEGIRDVREQAAHAALGGALSPQALRHVSDTASGSLRARAALDEAPAPLLRELAAAVDPALGAVAKAIDRAVEEDGSDLRDNASPKLRKLRGELRTGRQRVRDKLEQLVRSSELREHLQEEFITLRGGRPVLAVKASARRSVPGIVHDASDSGPDACSSSRSTSSSSRTASPRRRAPSARRSSGSCASSRPPSARRPRSSTAAVEATGRIDLTLALGTLSRGWKGAPVEVSDEVRLAGARHPLLDPKLAVPIDLDLGDLRALVISGPNTGGKTVALKTLGLAALLHQAGLRPPAETAALPVFDQVLADIGDRQSIEMSLSTFSGHVASIVSILNAAGERSLVLLDELASGTDPVEGSALAQALVARLAEQARLTLVTTHYPELKEWASATDGVANAGTGFDPDTHAPLYRIALGRPGTSHALQIAERLGLDTGVVASARELVTPERLRIQELLAEAESAERAAVDERASAEAERAEAERLSGDVRERERELEAEIAAVKASAAAERERAAAEAQRDLAEAREELEALRDGDPPGPAAPAERAGARPPSRRRRAAGGARRARDPGARRAAAVHRPARSR